MADFLHELVVKLTVDEQGFVGGLQKSLLSTEAWKKQLTPTLKGLDQAFGSIIKTVKNLTIGLAAVGAAISTHMVKGSLEAIDAMAKLSDRTRISMESLYGYQAAADDVGVSLDAVARAVTKLQRSVSEAASGNKELAAAFKQIGLDAKVLASLRPEEAFNRVVDALNKVPNEADAVNLKMQLLGKGANELTNFLDLGSQGFDQYTKKAKELGLTVNRFDASKVEAANDAWTEFGHVLTGIFNKLTVAISPYIKGAAEALSKFFLDGAGSARSLGKVVDMLAEAFGGLLIIAQSVAIAFQAVWIGASYIAVKFYEIKALIPGVIYEVSTMGDKLKAATADVANDLGNVRKGFEVMASGIKVAWTAANTPIKELMDDSSQALKSAKGEFGQIVKEATEQGRKHREEKERIRAEEKKAEENKAKDIEEIQRKSNLQLQLANEQLTAAMDRMSKLTATNWKASFHDWTEEAKKDMEEVADNKAAKTMVDDIEKSFKQFGLTIKNDASQSLDEFKEKFISMGESIMLQIKALPTAGPFDTEKMNADFKVYRGDLTKNLQDANKDQLFWEQTKNEQIQLITQQHLQDIEREEADSMGRQLALWQQGLKGKLSAMSGYLNNLASLQNTKSKEAFQVGKAAAMAQATIDMWQAAESSYAFGAKTGGPILGGIFAATAVAAGLNNINNIRSASFGGSGGGGGGGARSAPAAPAVDTSSSSVGAGGGKQNTVVNVTLNGDVHGTKQVRALVDQLSEAASDGAIIRVRGS